MRRSEKILLAILVVGLLAWQSQRLVNRFVIVPVRRSQAELDRLEQRIAEQDGEAAILQRAKSRLDGWRERSLPPDPLTAQRLYQQWLTDLAQDCGFAKLKVFPDRVTRKQDACVGVLVSVDAEATLGQLCMFLSRFYRTDLAQQITGLNIDSTQNQGDPKLRVTVMAEGLALSDAAPRQRLFPTGTLANQLDQQATTVTISGVDKLSKDARFLVRIGGEYLDGARKSETEWSVQRGADHSSSARHEQGALVEFIPLTDSAEPARDFAMLVARNPFAKPMPQVVEQPVPASQETPDIDPAEFTYLVAAFAQNDQRQAWLYDRLNNENVVIDPGKRFAVAGIEGIVQEIGDDFVVLDHDDSLWRLQLGKNLRSMERLPDPE